MAVLGDRNAQHGPSAVRRRVLRALALVLSALGLMFVFSRLPAGAFSPYRAFSKAVMGALAAVASLAPIALWDIGAAVGALVLIAALIRGVRRRTGIARPLSAAAQIIAAAFFVFVAGWALNHYAPPLASELDLEVSRYSVSELEAATAAYLERASALAPSIPRNDDGSLAEQDFFELARIAGAAYGPICSRWPIFQGSEAPVKALALFGEPLLFSSYIGIFWAPTGESAVPLNCANEDKPFTMCHEAAHRLGIASEQEANFAAFLACIASDDARFAYAGYYSAYAYCMNALWGEDPDRARALIDSARAYAWGAGAELVLADRVRASEHYKAYESDFKEVGDAVNNGYLTSFGQSEGIKSYGLVADYLIAWHEQGLEL